MLTPKNTILGFTILSCSAVFSGTMESIDLNTCTQSAYIKLGSGGSYSMNANVYADPVYWDSSPQGYNEMLVVQPFIPLLLATIIHN